MTHRVSNAFAVVTIAPMAIILGLELLQSGCPKQPKTITRDAATFTIETLASLKRQEEAAVALRFAATEAAESEDLLACNLYAESALLIEATARPQAYRALWLAGLSYPGGPDDGADQPDPGPASEPEPTSTICH